MIDHHASQTGSFSSLCRAGRAGCSRFHGQHLICGIFFTAFFLLYVVPLARAAETESFPQLQGTISIEVENDYNYRSDDENAELNDLYLTVEPAFNLHLTPAWSVQAGLVLEPVLDPEPGKSRAFKRHGLYLETMTLNYQQESFSLFGGKFTPNFGVAWEKAAGIYGTLFAEDYEVCEQIGFGGNFSFGNEAVGKHTVSASTFFNDTSETSDSLITRRGRVEKADGGVGNTEDFSSFAVGIDGNEMSFLPPLSYHAAFIRQAKGIVEEEDQQGLAFALEYPIQATDDVVVTPLVEYVHFDNANGTKDAKRDYLTASAQVAYKSWNQALVYGIRNTEQAAGDSDDSFLQLSLGYTFSSGISLDVGWMVVEEDSLRSYVAGCLVGYSLEF